MARNILFAVLFVAVVGIGGWVVDGAVPHDDQIRALSKSDALNPNKGVPRLGRGLGDSRTRELGGGV